MSIGTRHRYSAIVVAVFSVSLLHAAVLNAPAPKWTLKNSNQVSRTLADFKDDVILINFWASWCVPCQEELPELNRLAAEYHGQNVRVLAINVDSDRAAAQAFLLKSGLTHPALEVLWDTRSRMTRAYTVDVMPSSFIVDPSGTIRFTHAGFHPHDPAAWRQEIRSLLPQLQR